MNYEPVLPGPLRHKIAGWNLPPTIELNLLEEVHRHVVDNLSSADETTVRVFELSGGTADDPYGFYVQYTIQVYRNILSLLDIDIEYLPPRSPF
jgi:hypothetical protein